MLQHAEGGVPQVIEALRASDEEDALKFIEKYESLSESDQGKVTIEEVSVAAGVRPIDLLGVATKALFQNALTVAAIIASTAHPQVVEKSIERALMDQGVRDREMLHQAMGFLPAPKGMTLINQKIQVANFASKTPAEENAEEELPAPAPVEDLPLMDDDLRALQATTRKLLEAKKS